LKRFALLCRNSFYFDAPVSAYHSTCFKTPLNRFSCAVFVTDDMWLVLKKAKSLLHSFFYILMIKKVAEEVSQLCSLQQMLETQIGGYINQRQGFEEVTA